MGTAGDGDASRPSTDSAPAGCGQARNRMPPPGQLLCGAGSGKRGCRVRGVRVDGSGQGAPGSTGAQLREHGPPSSRGGIAGEQVARDQRLPHRTTLAQAPRTGPPRSGPLHRTTPVRAGSKLCGSRQGGRGAGHLRGRFMGPVRETAMRGSRAVAPGTAGRVGTVVATEGPAPYGRGTRGPRGRPCPARSRAQHRGTSAARRALGPRRKYAGGLFHD